MRTRGRRRLLLSAASAASLIAGALALNLTVAGVTLARESASQSSSNKTFTAGTVTLGASSQSGTCTYGSPSTLIYPGESLSTCSLNVTYSNSSNVPAYIGLDVLIFSSAGGGAGQTSPLYTANGVGLTLALSDGSSDTYTIPTSSFTGATTGPGGQTCTTLSGSAIATCYQAIDELAAHSGSTSFSPNTAISFTLTPIFATPTNAYQGGSATVRLTAHAVQFNNNALPTACKTAGNPNIGASCTASPFSWN